MHPTVDFDIRLALDHADGLVLDDLAHGLRRLHHHCGCNGFYSFFTLQIFSLLNQHSGKNPTPLAILYSRLSSP